VSNPGWDLQKAAYDVLIADSGFTALLGGERVYDNVPQDAAFPFVVLDQMRINDWSTGTERGSEHVLMLHVWSRYDGKRESYEIADAIRELLDDAELTLADNRLINLTHQYSDLKRDTDGEAYHAVMRFRAVTEPVM
jgi:hypothetical protein